MVLYRLAKTERMDTGVAKSLGYLNPIGVMERHALEGVDWGFYPIAITDPVC